MGACHADLGAAYLGAYPGVGAYHSTGQNSYLGAYPGVGACPGDYGISTEQVYHGQYHEWDIAALWYTYT